MTLDEQHKFFLERPTPTTPLEWLDDIDDIARVWVRIHDNPSLGIIERSSVRWKPEPKTVPAWPPVKPYWVKSGTTGVIHVVQAYDANSIMINEQWYGLNELRVNQWTTDFKTWHHFTKEVEE